MTRQQPAKVDPLDRLRAIRDQLAQHDQLVAERDQLLAQHFGIYRVDVLLDASGVSRSHLYRVAGPARRAEQDQEQG